VLVARGKTTLHRAQMTWALGLSQRVWCLFVDRSGLALDTRYIPGSTTPDKRQLCLYLLLSGRFVHHEIGVFEGPVAFVLTMSQLEGTNGKRASTFRSTGSPYIAIEMRLSDDHLIYPWRPNEAIPLDAATWETFTRAADGAANDDGAYAKSAGELVGRLASAGIVSSAVHESAAKEDGWAVQRLWRAIKPMAEGLQPASSLQEVSQGSGLSTRQTSRVIDDFLSLGVWGLGWRQITLHGRLKIAILLLSAEDASVDEVARIVGYGSHNAMARAFRFAGLDSPSLIQQRLREAT
jgi:AraC-like DNA-binding protein